MGGEAPFSPKASLLASQPRAPASNPMTEEIRYYEEELSEIVSEIQKGLDGLSKPKLTAQAKAERISELGSRLQRAKQVLHSFKVEMRDLPPAERTQFDLKSREYQQRITEMHGALQLAKQEAERQQIGVRTVDEMTTQEVLGEAGKVQDQSMDMHPMHVYTCAPLMCIPCA